MRIVCSVCNKIEKVPFYIAGFVIKECKLPPGWDKIWFDGITAILCDDHSHLSKKIEKVLGEQGQNVKSQIESILGVKL